MPKVEQHEYLRLFKKSKELIEEDILKLAEYISSYKDPIKLLKKLIQKGELCLAEWLILRITNYKQYIRYLIYAAELYLPEFEDEYPRNNKPRKAIAAAERCIKAPTKQNKLYAIDAADYASNAATESENYFATAPAFLAESCALAAANYIPFKSDPSVYSYHPEKWKRIKLLRYGIKLLFRNEQPQSIVKILNKHCERLRGAIKRHKEEVEIEHREATRSTRPTRKKVVDKISK